jgi:Ca2+-binding EF-hand superfamily protein
MNTLTNEFMRKADKNGDGQVSFKEFVEVVCGMEISEQAAEKLVKSKV